MNLLNPKKDELVNYGLRGLFELRGFTQTRVSKFEDYDLYVENRNFLDSASIITFMDMDGRLKALKPDVTLSVVKNMPPAGPSQAEKLYYVDEVCRLSDESREYKTLGQIGVELIGPDDGFTNLEIVDLALESLAVIGGNYVLALSHLGFVSGLLDALDISHLTKSDVLRALHAKSVHGIENLLRKSGADGGLERVLELASLTGGIRDVLPRAERLISGERMRDAYTELAGLCAALEECGAAGHVSIDFSVVNDLDYYNGLIFHGYVEGLPEAVLTGGRYDNLMKKMGKAGGAIGFAVSLSELNTYFKCGAEYDFDALISYTPDCDYSALLACAKAFTKKGRSVRLELDGGESRWKCAEYYKFDSQGLSLLET